MSETPNGTESDGRDATFTCSTLLMCLYIPGLSRKKPEESGTSRQPTTKQDKPTAVQEPARLPSWAASSLNSGSNIVFDFLVEPEEWDERGRARAVHGYCPSPCFDLPVELIRVGGERCSGTPVTSAFVFDGYQGGALKKVASCLPSGRSGVPGSEARPPHLVRFLSVSSSSIHVVAPARPPMMSSCEPPEETYHEFADHGSGVIQRRAADGPGRETTV